MLSVHSSISGKTPPALIPPSDGRQLPLLYLAVFTLDDGISRRLNVRNNN